MAYIIRNQFILHSNEIRYYIACPNSAETSKTELVAVGRITVPPLREVHVVSSVFHNKDTKRDVIP